MVLVWQGADRPGSGLAERFLPTAWNKVANYHCGCAVTKSNLSVFFVYLTAIRVIGAAPAANKDRLTLSPGLWQSTARPEFPLYGARHA